MGAEGKPGFMSTQVESGHAGHSYRMIKLLEELDRALFSFEFLVLTPATPRDRFKFFDHTPSSDVFYRHDDCGKRSDLLHAPCHRPPFNDCRMYRGCIEPAPVSIPAVSSQIPLFGVIHRSHASAAMREFVFTTNNSFGIGTRPTEPLVGSDSESLQRHCPMLNNVNSTISPTMLRCHSIHITGTRVSMYTSLL